MGRAVRSGARHVRLAGRSAHGRSGAADPSRTPGTRPRARPAPRSAGGTMKKFSRMPKSEGGGGGAAAGAAGGAGAASGSGGSSVGVRVFAVGRYQVTLEESLAEGTGGRRGRAGGVGLGCGGGSPGPRPLLRAPSRVAPRPSPRLLSGRPGALPEELGVSLFSRLSWPLAALMTSLSRFQPFWTRGNQ